LEGSKKPCRGNTLAWLILCYKPFSKKWVFSPFPFGIRQRDGQISPESLISRGGSHDEFPTLSSGSYVWDVLVVKASADEVYYPEDSAQFTIIGGGA